MTIYLDFNASTPTHPRVVETMRDIYQNHYGNTGSRTHIFGQKAKEIVERARKRISSILSVDSSEVIFTSGATESNNLAILGLARWGEQNGRKHLISTKIEHKAVLEPLNYLAKQGFDIDLIDVDSTGRIDVKNVNEKLRSDTLLVSVMHANNETGVIQPVHEIGELLKDTNVYFHIDAAQTFGKLVPELHNLEYDLLSISGHKIYGPQGIGALILRQKKYLRPPVQPITFGGGQEQGLRPGTLPVALIAGFGAAAEIAAHECVTWNENNLKTKNYLLSELGKVICTINGTQEYCLPNTLNVSFPNVDSEALMLALKEYYAVSNGSACTSANYKPSHVLTAMGLSEDLIDSAIRISWGPMVDVNLQEFIRIINSF
jgi:cysteine desulfurase